METIRICNEDEVALSSITSGFVVVREAGGRPARLAALSGCAIETKPATTMIEREQVATFGDAFVKAQIENGKSLNHRKYPATPPQELQARPFPLSLIVGHDEIKQAFLLAATNPRMGGVVLSGSRGTGKSVLARAVHRILPPFIERVKGSPYNIDPNDPTTRPDSFLLNELCESGRTMEDLETELVPTPFVTVPLNVMDDSLVGSVDLERSMEAGKTIFSPGLLAKAHRGILYVDEINLLDEEAANLLLNVIADGYVTVEREGLSLQYPCKVLLIASFNPEEGELRQHLLDRIAVSLSVDTTPLSIQQRVEAVLNVEGFSGGTREHLSKDAARALERAEKEEAEMQGSIVCARALLPHVKVDRSQILYLCEEATRAGCEGQRAEIFATEVARTCAALDCRVKVNAEDLRIAVMLAVVPRGRFFSAPPDQQQLPPPPDRLPPEQGGQMEQQKEEEPEEDQTEEAEEELLLPADFVFGVDSVPIDPKLLHFNQWTKKGKGGKRSRIFNLERGRFIKAIFPQGGRGRIAVGATLRSAAPHQLLRRRMAKGTRREAKLIYICKDDFRIKRMARKAGSLVVFVVDVSGSMALNRMGAAKGAALTFLKEAYKCRDKICLIAFHDTKAEMIVPPTKSMALTKSRLEGMPCGGGSPLTHALMMAVKIGINAKKIKQDVGRVVIVLLTDGRNNVPVCVSEGEEFDPSIDADSKNGTPSRKFLKDEALAVAKQLATLDDFNLLCIDTEDKFVGTGIARDVTAAARGTYIHLAMTHRDASDQIANLVREETA